MSLLRTSLIQARKATTLWDAWLQSKVWHTFLLQSAEIANDPMVVNAPPLAVALLLIEPFSASLAASAIREELTLSMKLGKLPCANNRTIKLYRVLASQIASRQALNLNVTLAPRATDDVNVDAPRLLECIWKTKRRQALLPTKSHVNEISKSNSAVLLFGPSSCHVRHVFQL